MFEYQRHFVWLLWQSKHARTASARVCGEFHLGSAVTGGFEWLRPYGTAWMRAKMPTNASAPHKRVRRRRKRRPLAMRRVWPHVCGPGIRDATAIPAGIYGGPGKAGRASMAVANLLRLPRVHLPIVLSRLPAVAGVADVASSHERLA